MNPPAMPDLKPMRVLRATSLLDCEVHDGKGEKIGAVEDLVLDRPDARAAYAIASFGALEGLSEKHFAIPFPAVRCDEEEQAIALDVTRAHLEKAPSFHRDAWPEFDRSYGATIYDYYDTPLYWTARLAKRLPTPVTDASLAEEELASHGMVRASAALGEEVLDADGRKAGTVEDFVFEAATGRIVYVVLSIGGLFGLGDRLVAVPSPALRRPPTVREPYVLDVEHERIAKARGFDRDRWPDLGDRRVGAALHAYYGLPT